MASDNRLLAAKYIRRQAKQLAEQLSGVRAAEDIEFVHRARVATRRLRSALRMFQDCFSRKRGRRWRKAIRQTTSNLGSARDRDVQIEILCGMLSTLNARECFPGIARVLVQLEHDRERLQRKVIRAVDRLEAKGVLREMQRVTKKILREAESTAENDQTPAAYAPIERHIRRQVDILLQHQDSLADPEDRASHHAMRIAAKRLRYTLEIARSVYPRRLDESVEAIKKVQSLLGDVHDCDVWVEHLDAMASEERDRIMAMFGHPGRLVRLQAGINYLREDRRCHRQAVFQQLVDYWTELGRRRIWEGLTSGVLVGSQSPAVATSQPAGGGSATATPMSDATSAAPMPEMQPCERPPKPVKSESWPPRDGSGKVQPAARRPLLTAGS